MLALVVVLLVIVLLLCVLMTGLLRSHADILRSLHELGAGVGDPAGSPHEHLPAPGLSTVPAPPAGESSSVHDISGTTPSGAAAVVNMSAARLTLLVFLSSGCATCSGVWDSLSDREDLGRLPATVRLVAVTKGTDFESPQAVLEKASSGVDVIMSTAAWRDYEVPGSPYFVLVDGASRRRIGEGVGGRLSQVADFVSRAEAEAADRAVGSVDQPAGGRRSEPGGRNAESEYDAELIRVGIAPGHPSLYPKRLGDVFPATGSEVPRGPEGTGAAV